MDQQTQSRRSGSYTANLLGNIRSHLAGLQGYDVMALELIQNADDAKADAAVRGHEPREVVAGYRGARCYMHSIQGCPESLMSTSWAPEFMDSMK